MGAKLADRPWVPGNCDALVQQLAKAQSERSPDQTEDELTRLVRQNTDIHETHCVNLNPATNVMNPKAEKLLACGLGSRPSLGYPGDKYEMGLEAIERIEVVAAELAGEVFGARYAELRVASGALANLYVFMATCKPGDAIIVPPPSIGGHVTHQQPGAAGLYGLDIHLAPVDAATYTVDTDALAKLADDVGPKLITIGGSLNLTPHPVSEIREIADRHGAKVMFDAAHLCGMIAGRAWQQPLEDGAHVMTMSTYKSLGGPPGGMLVSNDAEMAERLDAIAFPGLTANFDVAKTAALAMTLLDWKVHGRAYAATMAKTALALAQALADHGVAVFATPDGPTHSHQFALEALAWGGGHALAQRLRQANILTSGIGLPVEAADGVMAGLRLGTPEIVRRGMSEADMAQLAHYIAEALHADADLPGLAREVSGWRAQFDRLHFVRA